MLFGYNGQNAKLKQLLINEFGLTKDEVDSLVTYNVTVNGVEYYKSDSKIKEDYQTILDLIQSRYNIYAGWYMDDDMGLMATSEEFILVPKDGCTNAIYITR